MVAITLPDRWRLLAGNYAHNESLVSSVWYQIEEHYTEPQRYYHTLVHLETLFRDIDAAGVSDDAIAFAVFFHDIIYNPGSMGNERASAKLARKRLAQLCVPPALINQVIYMILCTRQHRNPRRDQRAWIFLDADMAILGENRKCYEQYLARVRMEFEKTPELLFSKGRTRFVTQTLKQTRIYQSKYFYETCERQARINLRTELHALTS